ncbi:MAG: Pili subunit [Candidatus Adlerbacteria bacterium]|nr:Pili subunit [Candidatus Adlerbacteria bacterium]
MQTSFNRLRSYFRHSRPARGFTLIELLVVSLIIVLITGFVLFRQQGFNSSTLLRSLAYSSALSVRQAQLYGVSVRESGVGTGKFSQGFGVQFGNSGLVDSSHYLLFADTIPASAGNGQYDAGEELPRFTLGNGRGTDYYISDFCAHNIASGNDECQSGGTTITSLTIFFRRPNPDGCFATSRNPGACAVNAVPVYSYAYVQLKAAAGTDVRTVKVSSAGQIAVCKVNADPASC